MQTDTDLGDPEAVASLFDRAAAALRHAPCRSHCHERLPGEGTLLVTGDLHDNPIHLDKVLRLAALDRGPHAHVVLQELIHGERLINGLDFSYRMLARVAELVLGYPGQVHPLLANHELAQLTGRGVSKGAGNSVELFDGALEYAFADRWEDVAASIDRFIESMPLALRTERGVFCAHSLPAQRTLEAFDVGLLDRELTDDDRRAPLGSAYLMVWGRAYTPETIETLAGHWGVRLFCLGHTHVETGIEAIGDRTLVLNSDHDQGRVLRVDLAAPPGIEEALMMAVPLAAV